MKSLKLHILAILFMLPFLGSDLYSKYLAHQHLTEESDQVVINDYVYAGLPVRNYGFAWSDQREQAVQLNSFTNISSNIVSVVIGIFIYCLLYSVETFWARLNCGMLSGGAWGNGLESAFFRSGTDFLYIHDTGTFLDMFVANVADVFVLLALLLFVLVPLTKSLLEKLFYQRPVTPRPQRKRYRYGKKKKKEVVERYKRGETLEVIAEFAETSVASVRGVLVHAGVYGDKNLKRLNEMLSIKCDENKYSELKECLDTSEYSRAVKTIYEGSYSVRGDTIDVWKFNSEFPIRFCFFGELLETFFLFDPITGERCS
jgi:lipoprotein signal peptidase